MREREDKNALESSNINGTTDGWKVSMIRMTHAGMSVSRGPYNSAS